MKYKRLKFITVFVLVFFLSWNLTNATAQKARDKVLYRVNLVNDEAKTVAVKQNAKDLELSLEGFGQPVAFKVNGGGIETCRTILEHKSEKATIILSLPIPTPNAPCQMTEGFVSINSQTRNIALTEETVEKTVGNDGQLRKIVEKYFGKI